MTVSNRAYSLLDIKEVDENARTFTGLATTPSTDLMDDIVEPKGAQFNLPIPLLWQHRADEPIGHVVEAKVTDQGILIKGRMPKVDEPGRLKDRLDEAWHTMKAGLVGGLSIGFKGIETERIKDSFGTRFVKWLWLELSAVTIAANTQASITSIKSIDTAIRAASGIQDGVVNKQISEAAPGQTAVETLPAPRVKSQPIYLRPKDAPKTMNATEHVAALEQKHSALSAQLQAIQSKVADEGRTKDEVEKEAFKDTKSELESIVEELKDAREAERLMKLTATPVLPTMTARDGSDARTPSQYRVPVQVAKHHPKGTGFIRMMGAKFIGQQTGQNPADVARQMFSDTPDVEFVLRGGFTSTNTMELGALHEMYRKTAVVAGNTTDATWAGPLVVAQNLASEFRDVLRAATIIGRIPGLSRQPFNITVPTGTSDPLAYWVGQDDVKPVSSAAFSSVSLPFHKLASIVVITQELAKFSAPSAEETLRRMLIAAITYRADRDFLDPTKAEVTGVNPASVTYNVTPTAATGTTADAFRDDLGTMLGVYLAANMSVAGLVLIMTSSQAMRLSLLRNTLGQQEFPNITLAGGSIEGIPVITSENMVATGGSPTDGYPIVAINAPEVFIADDGGVSIDMSTEASLQMNDSPDSPETASTVTVSMFQRNMVALKSEQFITWKKARSTAVQFISYARYQ